MPSTSSAIPTILNAAIFSSPLRRCEMRSWRPGRPAPAASSSLHAPRPAGSGRLFLLAPRCLAPGLVLTPMITLSILDGALQLLVLLIAHPALALPALIILPIAVAHV